MDLLAAIFILLIASVSADYPISKDSEEAKLLLKDLFLKNDVIYLAEERPSGDTDQIKENIVLVEKLLRKDEQSANFTMFKEIDDPIASLDLNADFFRFFFVDSDFMKKFYDGAHAVCIKKGTPMESVLHYFEAINSKSRLERKEWFIDACLRVEFGVVNFYDEPIDLFWEHNSNGRRIHQEKLEPGERYTTWRQTFIGHTFLIAPLADADISSSKANILREEIKFGVDCDKIIPVGRQLPQTGKRDDISEKELSFVDEIEENRAAKVKRTFTEKGYKRIPKEQFPKRLWGSIRTFWHNNRHNLFEELWEGRSNYVNWWDSTPKMAVVPFGLKAKWHEMFQPLLEEWSATKLEPTDLYGIRVYYNNSWLLNHVDRTNTHVISAIVNVDQIGIEQDWNLEIKSFDRGYIESDLQIGEAMFYESAKVMHGRPKPLKGQEYANVFFHYKPLGEDNWWKQKKTFADHKKDEL